MEELIKEIYKPYQKTKVFRHVVAFYPDSIWASDLVFMNQDEMIEQNEPFKYLLTVIDVYSRYAYARPLKSKKATEVEKAFQDIFDELERKPEKLYVDQGSEFYNKTFLSFLKKNDIEIYSTYGPHKASIIERFNRTLKEMMFKKLLIQMNWHWVQMVPSLIKEYNNRPHKGIQKETPLDVYFENVELEDEVQPRNVHPPKFKVGDRVRIAYYRAPFDKGYYPKWGYEIFTIISVKNTNPYTYVLEDYKGEIVKGSFYENELLKTKQKKDIYLVEKVLKVNKNKKGQPTSYLVKWLGYKDPTTEPAKEFEENFNDRIMNA